MDDQHQAFIALPSDLRQDVELTMRVALALGSQPGHSQIAAAALVIAYRARQTNG